MLKQWSAHRRMMAWLAAGFALLLASLLVAYRAIEAPAHAAGGALAAAALLAVALCLGVLRLLQREHALRSHDEAALRDTNRRLEDGLRELAERNLEVDTLAEMTSVLQACVAEGEAAAAVRRFGPLLFAERPGALYLRPPADGVMQLAAKWEDAEDFAPAFTPGECWGLRHARAYLVAQPAQAMSCAHVSSAEPYVCVPLSVQGDTLGLLHLGLADLPEQRLVEVRRLAETAARQIALAVANMRLRESLHQQSVRDPLTGLYNRRFLEEAGARELARAARSGRPFAVVMVDVDHFKAYNDAHGHEAGDVVLKAFGDFLRYHVRATDTACRYGGEEFTLLLVDTPAAAAAERCAQIREALRRLQVTYREQPLPAITVSMGIAEYSRDGRTLDALVRAADAALYEAKRRGRNREVVWISGPGAGDATA
jgi:diguanylate cyclase (GGDEF)-like protein